MTPERLGELLYESESETIDFKEGQYAFSNASDDEKAELLKDILGFANAWRRSEAYILIGVREARGGRSVVLGCEEHLADHSLQQFVNSKTNRPLRLSYETVEFEGKKVGVITIQQQERPFWLGKDYGRLKKDTVYVRRGSSTSPAMPASPDEIIKMKMASVPQPARLEVQFCEPDTGRPLGALLRIEGEFMQFPKGDDLPTHSRPQPGGGFALLSASNFLLQPNPEYYREASVYCHRHVNFRPVQLGVTNVGEVIAEDVRLEVALPTSQFLEVLETWEMDQEFPEKDHDRMRVFPPSAKAMPFHALHERDGDVSVVRESEPRILAVEYRKIQPGRHVVTDRFYVACPTPGVVRLDGRLFSKHLPHAIEIGLSIESDVSLVQVDAEWFLKWADDPSPRDSQGEMGAE